MKLSLKAARVNAGLTQKQAADAMGTKQSVISRWEKGQVLPSLKSIMTICRVYGVSYDQIDFLKAKE